MHFVAAQSPGDCNGENAETTIWWEVLNRLIDFWWEFLVEIFDVSSGMCWGWYVYGLYNNVITRYYSLGGFNPSELNRHV